jgi:hypothetical protein
MIVLKLRDASPPPQSLRTRASTHDQQAQRGAEFRSCHTTNRSTNSLSNRLTSTQIAAKLLPGGVEIQIS